MKIKLEVLLGMVVVAFALAGFIWMMQTQGLPGKPSFERETPTLTKDLITDSVDDTQKIKDTILRSIRVDDEAAYTFDSNKLATVYINDPRGGDISDGALADIRDARQDPSIQKDQVGYLDYKQAVVLRRKREYDAYMAGLRAKQANGTISVDEKLILDGETSGWPTQSAAMDVITAEPTPACVRALLETPPPARPYPALASSSTPIAYPAPDSASTLPAGDSGSIQFCPTPTRAPSHVLRLKAAGRGLDPATLPPEEFIMNILSIQIEGDVAKAIVSRSEVKAEVVLVKVNGQWYLAGAKGLPYQPIPKNP